LAYTRERSEGLQVYLDDADVPIDTNHLVQERRVVAGYHKQAQVA